ncbi:T9SS type A sorting domain-containing protein [Adhaeribacter sp. BT258]|uniref:T9SS type A sorting domain-containing protein n=1 Tax=Adhaeribacter terrigena TaxID=2793070 RepID=A0ABS1C0W7_9BACT|nr:T9SS type A sorting domain-containing protein [Adhaeribacter terrigena]MBK0402170.1 T9SS type A sorting domain-containing protein [Adhaeribacter terrigena]
MKRHLLVLFALFLTKFAFAQTATNFTANDCAGNSHTLFNELDGGKVIVLSWVMPCHACVGPAVTTYNVVQGFQNTNPNKVVMYLVDDYANTTCAALDTWATTNGLNNTTRFSNSAINMNHYGSTGMPKVVVLGGPNYAVHYNANNSVNQTSLKNAITAALSTTMGLAEAQGPFSGASISPNPSGTNATITLRLKQPAKITAEVYNHVGQKVADAFSGSLSTGENQIKINTTNLSNGLYFVNLKEGGKSKMLKMMVVH